MISYFVKLTHCIEGIALLPTLTLFQWGRCYSTPPSFLLNIFHSSLLTGRWCYKPLGLFEMNHVLYDMLVLHYFDILEWSQHQSDWVKKKLSYLFSVLCEKWQFTSTNLNVDSISQMEIGRTCFSYYKYNSILA